MGEWLLRKLQRQPAGRVARWRDLLLAQGSPDRDRSLAAALQYDSAPLRPDLSPASSRGRAVAALASLVTGRSGGHLTLGAGAKNELTFQADHSMGAGHPPISFMQRITSRQAGSAANGTGVRAFSSPLGVPPSNRQEVHLRGQYAFDRIGCAGRAHHACRVDAQMFPGAGAHLVDSIRRQRRHALAQAADR